MNLSGCVVGQIDTPHDMGDVLRGVVDHHGQLISPQPVRTVHNEVANVLREVLRLSAEPPIGPGDVGIVAIGAAGAQACRAWRSLLQAVSTGAGVNQFRMPGAPLASGAKCEFDIAPRASTGVGVALCK